MTIPSTKNLLSRRKKIASLIIIRGLDHNYSAQEITEDLEAQDIPSELSLKPFATLKAKQDDTSFDMDDLTLVKTMNRTFLLLWPTSWACGIELPPPI